MTTEQSTTLVTASAVTQACEAIKAEGKKPSVRTVRARLGGGSPNDISPLLADWKKGLRVVEAPPIQINKAIHDAIAYQIKSEADAAKKDATELLESLESDVEDLTQAGRAAESRVKVLDAELETAKTQLQTLMGQIDQLKADAEQVKSEAAEQVKSADERAATAITKADEDAERERQAREAAQVLLAKAELRLEALPRLESENERLQNALDAERTMRTDAERQAAATEAKAEGLTARLAALPRLEAEINKLQNALDAERTTRTDAERQVAATDAKAEGLTARLADAQEQLHQVQAQAKEQAKKANEAFVATAGQIGKLEGTIATLGKQLTDAELAKQTTQNKLDSVQQELDYTKQRHQQPEEPSKPKSKNPAKKDAADQN